MIGDENKENEIDVPGEFDDIEEPVDLDTEDKKKRKSSFIANERLNLF